MRISSRVAGLALGFMAIAACLASAQSVPASAAGLASLSEPQLLGLYQAGQATGLPQGKVRGTALVRPGTPRAERLSALSRLVWQGKRLDPAHGTATNRFFGIPSVPGRLYRGTSWLDGRPALILDYSQTSLIYRPYRDEIRQIAGGMYLGLMYDRTTSPPTLVQYFVLEDRSH